jgi:hypothetical protein
MQQKLIRPKQDGGSSEEQEKSKSDLAAPDVSAVTADAEAVLEIERAKKQQSERTGCCGDAW